VSSDLNRFLEFLEAQKARQAARFPTVRAEKVLAFMATTSRPGSHARVSVHRLRGVDPGLSARELRLRLAGPMPLRPAAGECLAVHLVLPERYQGYQVKTAAMGAEGEAALLERADDQVTVLGQRIYTVHHSPYTLKFFENLPFDEVRELAAGVRYALCAVGETANLSPRFVFHHEVRDGKLHLFHGDGLALKTFMNVKVNRHETRLVLDLDEWRGWALRGTVEEFPAQAHPEAWQRIAAGFAAGDWSRPSRAFRFTAEALEPIEPVG
jgi:hypothetical protein